MGDTKAIVPTKVIEGEIVSDQNAAIEVSVQQGKGLVRVGVPQTFDEWSPLQRAAILKSTPTWASYEVPYIMFVDAWAKKNGLDIFSGSVYIVEGKPATDDESKIANAMKTGRVEYLTVSDVTKGTNPMTAANDFFCEAKLKLKDESKERSYKAWLSEWRNPKNLAWQKYPTDRLQVKAQARVCYMAVPMSGDADAFIAAPTDSAGTPLAQRVTKQLSQSVEPVVEMAAKSS